MRVRVKVKICQWYLVPPSKGPCNTPDKPEGYAHIENIHMSDHVRVVVRPLLQKQHRSTKQTPNLTDPETTSKIRDDRLTLCLLFLFIHDNSDEGIISPGCRQRFATCFPRRAT